MLPLKQCKGHSNAPSWNKKVKIQILPNNLRSTYICNVIRPTKYFPNQECNIQYQICKCYKLLKLWNTLEIQERCNSVQWLWPPHQSHVHTYHVKLDMAPMASVTFIKWHRQRYSGWWSIYQVRLRETRFLHSEIQWSPRSERFCKPNFFLLEVCIR